MLRPGQAIAVCVLALLTIGVVMVNSAGMTVDPRQPPTVEGILLSRPTVYAGLAVFAMAACAMIPVRRLLPRTLRGETVYGDARRCWKCGYDRRGPGESTCPECAAGPAREDVLAPEGRVLSGAWAASIIREYVRLWPLWLACLGMIAVLATVYVPGIKRPRNGSHRWVTLHVPGLDSIQPSELAKWGMVVLVAWYGARYARRMKSFWLGLVPGLAAAGLVAGVIVIEDLGTGALLGLSACVVLVAAGARLWQLAVLCPVPLAGAVLAIVTNPYRMHRIQSFMNPYLDPQGKGFHMIQSMLAVAGGQGFGRGLGHGLQKFGYLPEDTTDFLFAVICEELGIAGAAAVLFLFGALAWSLWAVIRRERVPALKLVALGVLSTVGIQAVINLAVVTGLGPTKGIALPLLSSGGTGWILTAAALGLVIAIDRPVRELSRRTSAAEEPERSPAALGAVAATAAAAGVSLAELKPEAPDALAPLVEQASTPAEDPAPTTLAAAPEPIPGLPGKTGLLFDLSTGDSAPAPSTKVEAPAPPAADVVVTDAGRAWIDDAPAGASPEA